MIDKMDIKKENIKMKVTPEQSKQVQEICFELGISWDFGGNTLRVYEKLHYLYIINEELDWGVYGPYFEVVEAMEVSAEDFIRTKGFTISEEQEEPKPKALNNFNDYGFEADFEGEILKELTDHNGKKYFIGYNNSNNLLQAKTWTEDGKCWVGKLHDITYDLKPLKKLLKQVLLIKEDNEYELGYIACSIVRETEDDLKPYFENGWTYANLDEVSKLIKHKEDIKGEIDG